MNDLLLGRYEVIRVLGRGGMGTVYEARELQTGRRVAIKSMHAQPSEAGSARLGRFKQEAQIARSLNCPHIATLHEFANNDDEQVVFHVMELLQGEDLRALIGRLGALEPNVALRIAAQASAGLAAAHRVQVVHRDIKPENLFLARTEDGNIIVKVLDFGIAKNRGPFDEQATNVHSMTSTGEVLGTPHYMAPEQFEEAKHVDARCDVYSLGVTLYAMLSGKAPYSHLKSLLQIWRATMAGNAPSLVDRAPWVHPEIVELVEKAMHRDKDRRFADGESLFEALSTALNGDLTLREDMLVGIERNHNAPSANDVTPVQRHETQTMTEHVVDRPLGWQRRFRR